MEPTSEQRLSAEIDVFNLCEAVSAKLSIELLEFFRPYVRQKIVKNDGSLLKRIADPLKPIEEQWGGKDNRSLESFGIASQHYPRLHWFTVRANYGQLQCEFSVVTSAYDWGFSQRKTLILGKCNYHEYNFGNQYENDGVLTELGEAYQPHKLVTYAAVVAEAIAIRKLENRIQKRKNLTGLFSDSLIDRIAYVNSPDES